MLNVVCARNSATGDLLRAELVSRGVQVVPLNRANAAVCWGSVRPGGISLPVLNARAGTRTKLEELEVLRNADIRIPRVSLIGTDLRAPMLGRRLRHSQGRDIIPVLQADQAECAARLHNCDFFTEYIPTQREVRVWIYRRKLLAAYEKHLEHPEQYLRVGRNHTNGFAFVHIPDSSAPAQAVTLAAQSVDALDYDFGAVDMVQDFDNEWYVLEVNSAPGQETVRRGLGRLADKIARWEALGYPDKRGRNAEETPRRAVRRR